MGPAEFAVKYILLVSAIVFAGVVTWQALCVVGRLLGWLLHGALRTLHGHPKGWRIRSRG